MKTILPEAITTVEEAKAFLKALHDNGEDYHPEDSPETVYNMYTGQRLFTDEEAPKVKALIHQIYNLPGNAGKYPDLEFDPCGYLLELDGHVMDDDDTEVAP
jgi:hypothetical protein